MAGPFVAAVTRAVGAGMADEWDLVFFHQAGWSAAAQNVYFDSRRAMRPEQRELSGVTLRMNLSGWAGAA